MEKHKGIVNEIRGINDGYTGQSVKDLPNLEKLVKGLMASYPTDKWKSSLVKISVYIVKEELFLHDNDQTAMMFLLLSVEPIIKRQISKVSEKKIKDLLISGDESGILRLLVSYQS